MEAHRILAPRITVLITTIDKAGVVDVAPYSFITPVSFDPPTIGIAIAPQRHTLDNIEATKEFVINVPTAELARSIIAASKPWRKDLNKLKESWLSTSASKKVKPPRINECVAWMECTLDWIKPSGDHNLVIGKIIQTDWKPEAEKDGMINLDKYPLAMHLGGKTFILPGATIDV
jgi:flavin reductase (DIM6/NTAB) family NADH-FMN oxidoreductase RutF